jgi:hypothetical protein
MKRRPNDAIPRTGVVIDEPKRANGRTRFTMFWFDDARKKNRSQCFDAILEDYLQRDPKARVFLGEADAKKHAGWLPEPETNYSSRAQSTEAEVGRPATNRTTSNVSKDQSSLVDVK